MENEVKFCSEFVTKNAELQAAYQSAQKSIIMLGELCRRQEEMLNLMEPTKNSEDVEDIKMAYEEEIRCKFFLLFCRHCTYEFPLTRSDYPPFHCHVYIPEATPA